ncbi:hypothetical protein C6A87_024785 [Mycobacterium sp. ITM-2016-00317]|uniref:hypothetical protein n=1 Tax=Mycobacterium sp. ITM-2016-00317 TaxID=2099694 RepID=UPI00287F6261|nr:hypothetical protein [Mycobacterium sp. ITM-2016-00317]WNG86973.1 hypothetical protein C6A87_024785 [Mycobacterium sp. ITM-2016-00317]
MDVADSRVGDHRKAVRGIRPAPITDVDLPAVADFLRTVHNGRIPWSDALTQAPWSVDSPNHGFMLRDGERVVGTLLALYSQRQIAGRTEWFCNLTSWCVLPEYRARSMSLLNAVLAQEGYHFTVLSPDVGPREILSWLKFRVLDTSAALVPNLPWPTLPGGTRISADPDVIERTLTGVELALYHDHARALAASHLVLSNGKESCYVMFRKDRYKGAQVLAVVLHVSNPSLFQRSLKVLTRHLLIHHGAIATMAELRITGCKPLLSIAVNRRPKMYCSTGLQAGQIDYLYSELVCVPS